MQHPTGPPPTRMPTDEEAEDEPEDDQGDDANNSGQEALGKGDSAVMKTCPHVAGVHIDVVKNTLLDPSLWSCRECNHTESCWACLSCGYVGCSRFQESHGLLHYEATHHPIVFEINTKYCHCYKCDAYLDNDNKRGDIAALRMLVEQLQTHTICESRTRSGRLLRRSSSVKMHPRDYTSDDRVSTAVKHWQLNTIVRAFSQWRWFVDAQKAAEEGDDEHRRLLPPAPGLSLFQPPTASEGAHDAGTKATEHNDDDEEEEEEDADGRSGEPSEEESEDSNDDAKTSNKRKRGDEEEHEHERDAKEEQEPHSGEAEDEGEAERKQNNDKEETLHQEGVVGEEDAPAPVFATPPPPKRRAKRRKGLLADLDMDGPSLRPQAIFLSPVARRNLVPGQTGLRNLGNTCFMNAVLQALSNTLQFRNYFVADFLPKDKKGKLWRRKTIDCLKQITTQQPPVLGEISISAEIHNIFRVVWSGRWAVVTPFALLDALWKFVPRFRNYQQQDAQEFLVYLLDKLHDELTSLNGGREVVASPSGQKRQGESIISKTFNGELLSQVTCSACGNVSSRREPYLDLLLDIPIQHAGGSRSTRGNRKTNVPSCSLYDCLDSFTWPEKLTGYYCEKCKSNQDASKRLAIQTLPDVLCVVLKRFCWTTTSRAKVDTKVLFPLIGLDLSAFCSEERENAIFDLSSVVIHHGSGPSAGHYTAFCYHTEQGTWLHFNDCRVSVSSPQEAASAQAYMLFYQRRSASDSKIPIPAVIPASDALAGENDEAEAENNDDDNHNNSNKRKQRRGTKKSKETDGEEEDVDGDDDEKEAAGKRKQRGTAKRRRVDEADEKKQQRRDERDLEALKRDELVVALRKRGLRTTGAKAVLLKRLQDAIRHDNDDDDQADDDGDDSGGRDDGDDSEQENEKTSKPRPAADSGVTKRRLAKRTNRGTNK